MSLDLTHIKLLSFKQRRQIREVSGLSEEAAAIEAAGGMLDEIHFMMCLWMRSRGWEPGTVVELGQDERDRP